MAYAGKSEVTWNGGRVATKTYRVRATITGASGFVLGGLHGVEARGLLTVEAEGSVFASRKGKARVSVRMSEILMNGVPAFVEHVGREFGPHEVDIDIDDSGAMALSGRKALFEWSGKMAVARDWATIIGSLEVAGFLNALTARAEAVAADGP